MNTASNKTPNAQRGSSKRLAFGALALISLGAAAMYYLPFGEWRNALANWGENRGLPEALLTGLLFLPICLLMLPLSTPLAYTMAFAFGTWAAFAGIMMGAILGAMACFIAGRTLAREFVERKKQDRPLLAALDSVLDERSFGMIALVRLSPLLPYALVGYALGATRITFWRHGIATAIAIAPQTLLTCYIGATVGDLAKGGEKHAKTPMEYAILALGIVVAFIVIGVISKRTKAALEAHLVPDSPPGSAP